MEVQIGMKFKEFVKGEVFGFGSSATSPRELPFFEAAWSGARDTKDLLV